MSFMQKIFGTAPQQTPPVQNQQVQNVTNNPAQNIPTMQTASTGQTAPNGVVPQDSATPPNNQNTTQQESPTDKFKDLWQPNKPVDGENTPANQNQPQGFDPQKLMEAAGKVDFTKVLNQEDLTKIAAGGNDAVQVFAQSLNKVAQQVYGQSVVATTKIVEHAVGEAQKRFEEKLPGVVSRTSARDSLLAENPAFANPAVAPLVDMIQSQFAQKYPKATPAELNKMAKEYLHSAADVFNPSANQSSADNSNKSSKEENWDSWITQ